MRTIGASGLVAMTAVVMTVFGAPASAYDGNGDEATVTRRLVVSVPDRKLALIENDQVVRIYPVAVGAAVSPSPIGTFSVVNRVTNPTYYSPGKVVEPGAANPVGTRWIGLSLKGFGIHGTDNPRSIGFAKSHGCIRCATRTSSTCSTWCAPATSSNCTRTARRKSFDSSTSLGESRRM
jgi:lipoprotein-anchoring transpeptidase ErfK/SrfK